MKANARKNQMSNDENGKIVEDVVVGVSGEELINILFGNSGLNGKILEEILKKLFTPEQFILQGIFSKREFTPEEIMVLCDDRVSESLECMTELIGVLERETNNLITKFQAKDMEFNEFLRARSELKRLYEETKPFEGRILKFYKERDAIVESIKTMTKQAHAAKDVIEDHLKAINRQFIVELDENLNLKSYVYEDDEAIVEDEAKILLEKPEEDQILEWLAVVDSRADELDLRSSETFGLAAFIALYVNAKKLAEGSPVKTVFKCAPQVFNAFKVLEAEGLF